MRVIHLDGADEREEGDCKERGRRGWRGGRG